ncbi:MAG: hypothetical protein WC120_05225 [Parcubacteria group bacterium]
MKKAHEESFEMLSYDTPVRIAKMLRKVAPSYASQAYGMGPLVSVIRVTVCVEVVEKEDTCTS